MKKAQITAFITIGLILLLTLLYLIFLREKSLREIKQIQPELIPIQQYIESCVKTISYDAITKVGLTGGYIKLPARIESNPLSYLDLGIKIPYWWYNGKSSIPSEGFITKQISDYVVELLPKCINNFEAFSKKYNIIELANIKAITSLAKDDVKVELIYPIKIKDKFNKTLAELHRFKVRIPIRLKKVYELARDIMEAENNQAFFERRTIDLITLDNEIPDTGISVSCSKKVWHIPLIKKRLKELLRTNIPFIKVRGTLYKDSYVPPSKFSDSYYNYHYVWDIGEKRYNLAVGFTYDDKWPLFLYARPNRGLNLESNAIKGTKMLSFLCFHLWHFTYDIIYPVLVTIRDEETIEHEGYTFNFAFKVAIDHNQPRRENFPIQDFRAIEIIEDEIFCNDLYNEITIYAIDPQGVELKDVNLTLLCGKFKCRLGETKPDYSSGGIPYFKAKLPYCVQGLLKATKPGYKEAEMPIQTDTKRSYTIKLYPIKGFNISVVKHLYKGKEIGPEELVKENELVTIVIKEDKTNLRSFIAYPKLNETILPIQGKYNYEIEAYLMEENKIKGGYKANWSTRLEGNLIKIHTIYIDAPEDETAYFIVGLKSYSKLVPKPEIK